MEAKSVSKNCQVCNKCFTPSNLQSKTCSKKCKTFITAYYKYRRKTSITLSDYKKYRVVKNKRLLIPKRLRQPLGVYHKAKTDYSKYDYNKYKNKNSMWRKNNRKYLNMKSFVHNITNELLPIKVIKDNYEILNKYKQNINTLKGE